MRERALSVHARVGSPASVRALLNHEPRSATPSAVRESGQRVHARAAHGQRVRVRDYCHVPCAHGRFLLPDTARRKRGLAAVRRPRAIMSTLTTTHQVPPPSACAVPSPPSSPASSPSCRMHSTASSRVAGNRRRDDGQGCLAQAVGARCDRGSGHQARASCAQHEREARHARPSHGPGRYAGRGICQDRSWPQLRCAQPQLVTRRAGQPTSPTATTHAAAESKNIVRDPKFLRLSERSLAFGMLGDLIKIFENPFHADKWCRVPNIKQAAIFWCTRIRSHMAAGLGEVPEEVLDPAGVFWLYDLQQARPTLPPAVCRVTAVAHPWPSHARAGDSPLR